MTMKTTSSRLFFLLPSRKAFLRQNLHGPFDRNSYAARTPIDPPVTVQRRIFSCPHLAQLFVSIELQARLRRRLTLPGQSWIWSFLPRLLSSFEMNYQGRYDRRRKNDCRKGDTKKRDVARSEIA